MEEGSGNFRVWIKGQELGVGPTQASKQDRKQLHRMGADRPTTHWNVGPLVHRLNGPLSAGKSIFPVSPG